MRWAEDDIGFITVKRLDSFGEGGVRNRGRVGVDEADRAIADGEDIFGGSQQAFAELVATLGDEGEGFGQQSGEEDFVTDWRVGDETGAERHGGKILCGVA
jgi:hypothetical protein